MFRWVSHSGRNICSLIVTSRALEINLHSGLKSLLFLQEPCFQILISVIVVSNIQNISKPQNKQILLRGEIKVKIMACWEKIHSVGQSENNVFIWGIHTSSALDFTSVRNFYNALTRMTLTPLRWIAKLPSRFSSVDFFNNWLLCVHRLFFWELNLSVLK